MLATTWGFETRTALNRSTDGDAELIRAVAKGDRAAFERLFRLYYPRIYKFSVRMLRDHSAAEEVANDSLYAVWNGAAKFRGQSAASSWILGIAYRRSLKSYSRDARHVESREPAEALDTLTEPSPGADPETHADNALEVDQMQQALLTLSSNHRAVLELIALGYSVSEIASIVGCPENTVKTRTFHARRQLQTALRGRRS